MANTSKLKSNKSEQEDLCWKDYEQMGMKEKGGKQVPNCVPENKSSGSSTPKKKS